MKTTIKGVDYYYQWLFGYQKDQPTLICLHGFTGSSQTFLPVFKEKKTYNILVVDLIGHGKTSSFVHPYRYQFTSVCQDIVTLTNRLKLSSFSLFGYSMGGRVALGIACLFPLSVERLFLESSSPGLETAQERQQRKKKDEHLAQFIATHSIEEFVNKWENLSLFASQRKLSSTTRSNVRKERLAQEKFGLICSLWFMGTGVQPSFWQQLYKLRNIPTFLIVGTLDTKFNTIAAKIKHVQPTIKTVVIEDSGHCIHLEHPDAITKLIDKKMVESENVDGNL